MPSSPTPTKPATTVAYSYKPQTITTSSAGPPTKIPQTSTFPERPSIISTSSSSSAPVVDTLSQPYSNLSVIEFNEIGDNLASNSGVIKTISVARSGELLLKFYNNICILFK